MNYLKQITCKIFFAVFLLMGSAATAQPFADEIAAFRKADSIQVPFAGQHPIVFAGSSSFRMWKNLAADFPGLPVINRGFGGSTLPDMIRYADDLILKYLPKQVVIYCGENDIAATPASSPEKVLKDFKTLYGMIRQQLPYASIVYVSIKPSPSRAKLQADMIAANNGIKKFLKKKKRTVFVDVYQPMLNSDGTMRNDLYIGDNLHMNAKGYAIWQALIAPHLLK
ncbi:MAG: hypothetical protein JWQ27_2108 [Ferruginibacter sp.]|nr:hypothetical protein [Ferruginibacter sp.]